MLCRCRMILAIAAVLSSVSASSAIAGFVSFSVPSVAVQDVQLFPGTPIEVNATLTAVGTVDWNLDVDANGDTINSDSSITAIFHGFLPIEFGPLAGLPFDLFSLPTGQTVTATNNGTVVTVDTTFGLSVPLAGLSFYTLLPSTFVTSVSGIPFTTYFATSPDLTTIYTTGDIAVGVSFNRTVSSVPEPSTITLAAIGLVSCAGAAWRKRRTLAE